jgi:hypothetical protein
MSGRKTVRPLGQILEVLSLVSGLGVLLSHQVGESACDEEKEGDDSDDHGRIGGRSQHGVCPFSGIFARISSFIPGSDFRIGALASPLQLKYLLLKK